jgi:hypothetical protein
MEGMCDKAIGKEDEISGSLNHTVVALIMINFVGYLLFITSIYKLRNIKKEFNIRVELSITFFAWFVCT